MTWTKILPTGCVKYLVDEPLYWVCLKTVFLLWECWWIMPPSLEAGGSGHRLRAGTWGPSLCWSSSWLEPHRHLSCDRGPECLHFDRWRPGRTEWGRDFWSDSFQVIAKVMGCWKDPSAPHHKECNYVSFSKFILKEGGVRNGGEGGGEKIRLFLKEYLWSFREGADWACWLIPGICFYCLAKYWTQLYVEEFPFASASVPVKNPSPLPLAVQLVWCNSEHNSTADLRTIYVNFISLFSHWIILYCWHGKVCNLFSCARSAFLPLNVHFCILFLVRHYVITKIYSYLIMIYCSHLFYQLWHIFSGICTSDLYRNLPGHAFHNLIKHTPKSFFFWNG